MVQVDLMRVRRRKGMKKFKNAGILSILMCMILGLVGCGAQKISIDEYCIINVEGYDGYGTASIDIDDARLNALVESDKMATYIKSLSDDIFTMEMASYYKLTDLIEFNILEDNDNFSNGDVVTVKVEVSDILSTYGETLESMEKGLGISIADTTIEVIVEGLEEAKVLDVMSVAEEYIVYEGANGGAEASVKFPADFACEIDGITLANRWGNTSNTLAIIQNHTELKQISFRCEYDDYLSENQVYTLYLDDDYTRGNDVNIEVGDTGYIINTEKEIVVPELGDYIRTTDELTPEFKSALDTAIAEYIKTDNYTINDYYWGTLKSSSTKANVAKDEYHIFVYVSYQGFFGTSYKLCETDEMIKLSDGTYKFTVYGETLWGTEEILDDNYDLEEIHWQ